MRSLPVAVPRGERYDTCPAEKPQYPHPKENAISRSDARRNRDHTDGQCEHSRYLVEPTQPRKPQDVFFHGIVSPSRRMCFVDSRADLFGRFLPDGAAITGADAPPSV